MIFSKLFSNKSPWQHKDSAVRITAIGDLNINDSQSQQILRDLAKLDSSELVRRSALLKLNNIDDWQHAMLNDKSTSIKTHAEKAIVKQLIDNQTLTHESKITFIANSSDNVILEQWLNNERDPQLAIALVKAINKPQHWLSLYNKTTIIEVQRYLIDQTNELVQLQKFCKKALNDEIAEIVNNKIKQLEELKQKPIRILKQVQLVLAKLLVLKDQPDYSVVVEKQAELTTEWLSLTEEFDCLAAQEIESLFEKHHDITGQLHNIFAVKKEQYEQEKIAKKLIEAKKSVSKLFSDEINEFAQTISTAVFENNNIDEDALKSKLSLFTDKVSQSVLSDNEKQVYIDQAKQQESKLLQLPEIAESVATATQLISRISQVAPPKSLSELTSKENTFEQWQTDWKKIENIAQGSLPDGIINAKEELISQWLKAMRPLHQEQKQLFSQTQKKVYELKRLFSVGKFNAAFGVHKRFIALYQQLSASQQHKLQRDFEFIEDKISELSDWEHYIATPRKQELLAELKILVEQPLDNPNDQAEKVKAFRNIWNSLGHADEEVDKAFNNEFNLLIEQAFAPCRMYYAEQEKIREQNLVTRNQILNDVHLLVDESTELEIKQIDTELNKLQQQWREAGEVNRDVYKKINQQFLNTIKPLKAKVFTFHSENAKAKQNIITKTMAIVDHDNIFEAVEILKTLQTQWKDIGFSGQKVENKLWLEFRSLNDIIFSKRDEIKLNDQKLIDARILETEQEITKLSSQLATITKHNNKQALQALLQDIEALYQIQREIKPIIKKIINAIEELLIKVKAQLALIEKNEISEQWNNVFSVLTDIATNELSTDEISNNLMFKELLPSWQKKILDGVQSQTSKPRDIKTLEIEVLASIDSPAAFQSERMAVQIQLMQEKMTSGEQIDLQQNFNDWLASGAFTKNDISLINRIKPVFCN